MRRDRMLKPQLHEAGSAPLESVFAIVFLMALVLGVMQVALALYGRNVVMASAHEGARAGIELARSPAEAAPIAEQAVRSSAGGAIDDLHVEVITLERGVTTLVEVHVSGTLDVLGALSLPIPIEVTASSLREDEVP